MTDLCLCSHFQGFHDKDAAGERTRGCYVPACGCLRFRPDPRSRLRDEPGEAGDAATTEGAA